MSSPPCSCRGTRPRACGGDVLLRIAPGTSQAEEHWPGPAVRVQVQAVVAGSLIHVAGWDHLSLDLWPEAARAAAAFAMGALKELQEHGADVGAPDQVDVETAAELLRPGSPACRHGEGRRWGVIPGMPLARGRAPGGARPLPSWRRAHRAARRCGPDAAMTASVRAMRPMAPGVPACARQGAHGGGSRGGPHGRAAPGAAPGLAASPVSSRSAAAAS